MKNAGEYLSISAPYFDPVADVVPFYFEWPARRSSDYWADQDTPDGSVPSIVIDHKWGEIIGIEVFNAAEFAFKGIEHVQQQAKLRRLIGPGGKHQWELVFSDLPTARTSAAMTTDGSFHIQANWDENSRLTGLLITRLRDIVYSVPPSEQPVDITPACRITLRSNEELDDHVDEAEAATEE